LAGKYPYPSIGLANDISTYSKPTAISLTKRNSESTKIQDIGYMKKSLTLMIVTAPVLLSASIAFAQNIATGAPEGGGATTIYRQVMPDGRIVYSDTVTKGVKIDRILSVPTTENRSAASKPLAAEQMRGAGNTKNTTGSEDSGR
jgi:hypothetical protein